MTSTDTPTSSTVVRDHAFAADAPAEAMLASMKLAGIDRLWFVSGSEIGVFQEGSVKHRHLDRPTPEIMTMTHENAALAAACGDTLVTGKPSAVAFHVEVGLLNAGGAIHNADRGRHPVLIVSGYPASAHPGTVSGSRNARIQWYQQVPDQGGIVRQYMRWDHKLASYDNAGAVITRAVQVMLSEPQGPAYLAMPREVGMGTEPVGSFPLLDQLRPAPVSVPDLDEIARTARALISAADPVIVVSRAGRDPQTMTRLVELAEALGARVFADTHHGLTFPGAHPLNQGVPAVAPMPAEADCVLVLDSLVPWMPGQYDPSPDTTVITVGPDPIQRLTPVYQFPTDIGIRSDVGLAVTALLEEVRVQLTADGRERAAARRNAHTAAGHDRLAGLEANADADARSGVITSAVLSRELGRLEPDVTIAQELVDGSLMHRTEPGTLAGPGGSSIGFVAPMAIGMKTADRSRRIVSATGDGSWMFANPQVCTWASAFHKAPVLFVVFNNRGYRTGTHEVLRAFPNGYAQRHGDLTGGWFDPSPNFAAEAAASGHFGERVSDPAELSAALQRGLAATEEGVPAVLDVWLPKHITKEV